jgi:hypothetical protein
MKLSAVPKAALTKRALCQTGLLLSGAIRPCWMWSLQLKNATASDVERVTRGGYHRPRARRKPSPLAKIEARRRARTGQVGQEIMSDAKRKRGAPRDADIAPVNPHRLASHVTG